MKVTKNKKVIVTIELNEDEAIWLKNAMQNPLHEQSIEDEEIEEQSYRCSLFRCLNNALDD